MVALQLWVGVGSADDPPEMAGLAHLFEHTLFASTKKRGAGQIARELDAIGGTFRAWTSFDQTAYQLLLAAPYIDTGVDILADVLTGATFDAAELERARKVVAVELRQAEESPERAASQALFRAAFTVHPYARPVLGTDSTVASLTREQLIAGYQRIYGGRNLTLVAVGDFSAPALKDKVTAAFASLRNGDAPAPRRVEPAQTAPRTVVLARDLAETLWRQACVSHASGHARRRRGAGSSVGDPGPAPRHGRAARSAPRAQPAAGQRCQRVRVRIARWRALRRRGQGATGPARGTGIARCSTRCFAWRAEEVSPAELQAARTQALAGIVRDQDSPAGYARKLGFFASIGGDIAHDQAYRTRRWYRCAHAGRSAYGRRALSARFRGRRRGAGFVARGGQRARRGRSRQARRAPRRGLGGR